MERKLEWTTDAGKTGCGHYCSHCRVDVMNFTKRANKEGLLSLLTKKKVQGATDKATMGELLNAVKRERKAIFHKDDVPPMNNQSQIHAVCL